MISIHSFILFFLNLIAYFRCGRATKYTKSQPYWPNTGKFDKVAFSISVDHYVIGMTVGSTIQSNVTVQISIKLTDTVENLIANKSSQYAFTISNFVVLFFDRPYRITAGQQYIAATLVYAST